MTELPRLAIEPIDRFDATLRLPASKSITNRALLLAALCDRGVTIETPLDSDDSQAFVEALRAMGADLQWKDENIAMQSPLPRGLSASVQCRDAGTAARFLPPAATALGCDVFFDASQQMRRRPMADLFDSLRTLGARTDPVDGDRLPQRVIADGLDGGAIDLDGRTSSQFLSGLLMAAPLAAEPLTIRCNSLISRPYVDMTLTMMEQFGRSVERDGYREFSIRDLGRYTRAEPYAVEADASTASYFFALAAATNSRIRVTNLRRSSMQGDIGFLEAIEAMGATVQDDADGIVVQGPEELEGLTIDMSDISDVMMTLACIAPLAKSPTSITNVGQARVKESDRIDAVVEGLTRLGIKAEQGPDWLTINPGRPLPAVIDPRSDHRIAMSFAVLGMATSNVTVENPGCVAKTCPTFFELCDTIRSARH